MAMPESPPINISERLDRIEQKLDVILSGMEELENAAKPLLESFSSGTNPLTAMLSGLFGKSRASG